MSDLLAVGISHRTAPLELRERVAMTEGRAAATMRNLAGAEGVDEAVIVSTCNRTEIYLVGDDAVATEASALAALATHADVAPTELAARLYTKTGRAAAEHLLRVTSGMDSVILGEAEIQGQVRRAYDLALVEGAAGPVLNKLFQAALSAGGRVRQETALSRGGVSISSVAVELAEQTLGNLDGQRVMLIGAGETARLVAKALATRGSNTAFIANRHHDRALQLAAEHGGEALTIEQMRLRLGAADLVISATHSPHHVIEPEQLRVACDVRAGRALVLIDLAVPRDIDPNCQRLPGVTLFDIDDLQELVERNSAFRARDLDLAQTIIDQETDRFWRWHESLRVLPTIAALKRRVDTIIHAVLSENDARWEGLTRADRRRLKALADAIGKRLMDEPIRRLKAGSESEAEAHAAVLQELFDLDPGPPAHRDTGKVKIASLDERRRLRQTGPLRATGRD